MIMSEGISKTKMKASDFRFTRVRGWLGGDQTERIEGWKTYIYEAAGKMKAVNTFKVRVCHTCDLGRHAHVNLARIVNQVRVPPWRCAVMPVHGAC